MWSKWLSENIREVGVHLGGDFKVGGGVPENGVVKLDKVEHGFAVHFYAITSGPVWGDG